jgi:hypothetical protein
MENRCKYCWISSEIPCPMDQKYCTGLEADAIRKQFWHSVQSRSQEQSVVISGHSGSLHKLPLSESIRITNEMKSCIYYEKDSNCGCGKSRCKAGLQGSIDTRSNDGSSLVTFLDCAVCLNPDRPDIREMRDGK